MEKHFQQYRVLVGTPNVETEEDNLLTRDDILRLLQENLLKTQKIMKKTSG